MQLELTMTKTWSKINKIKRDVDVRNIMCGISANADW